MSDHRRKLDLYYQLCLRESSRSLERFLFHWVIDSRPEPKPFGQIAEPWQWERVRILTPAIEHVTGHREEYGGPRNFWSGFAKGHDKTSHTARILTWVSAFSNRPLRGYVCAKDGDQARLITDFMGKEIALNPWVRDRVEIRQKNVTGASGTKIEILTSDAGGTQGVMPDIVVCEELTHWDSKDLFDSVFSGRLKRRDCLFWINTNAGQLGSWQHQVRELAKNSDRWYFYEQPPGTRLATWLDEAAIEEDRKILTPSEAARLIDNRWIDPSEDCGYLSREEILGCVGEVPPVPPGVKVYVGLDYGTGIKRKNLDRTALCVLWYDGHRVWVVECLCLGNGDKEVPVADVDAWVEAKLKQYPFACLVFDKHQLLATVQRLEGQGREVVRFDFKGGKNNFHMAENLRTLVQNGRIKWAADAGSLGEETLTTELVGLITKKTIYGYRFDHESQQHDDRVSAVGMAALQAVTESISPPVPQKIVTPHPTPPASPVTRLYNLDWATRRGLFGLS